jgi:hypothetical protein
MTLALTTSLSSTITKSELEGNFTSIQNKFNAGVDNSDIKAGAGIDISKLSASKEYTAITLSNPAYTWGSAGATIFIAPLPGLSGTQSTWTLVAANWFVSDTGSSAGTIDVSLAYYNSGTLTDMSVLVNEESMTVSSDGNGNSGTCTIDASSVWYHSSTPRVLVLRQGATVGTGVLNSAGHVGVTLLLERNIQS